MRSRRTRWRGSRRPWKNAHLTVIRTSPAAAIRMGISFMAGFRSWGGLLVQGLDVGAQDAAGGTGVEVDFGGDLAGDPGRAVER